MIQNKAAFDASLWNWDVLAGCFGGKIRPTDVDGLVERNGKFLFLEAKGPGVLLKRAQEIVHERLLKMPNNTFTVIVVWGEPGKPTDISVNGGRKTPATLEDLRSWCSRWYAWADKQRPEVG